jgi:hypothetical protein
MPEETNLLDTRLFHICAARSAPFSASVALLLFTLWGAGVRFPERTLRHTTQVITPIVQNSHTSMLMLHIMLRPLKISVYFTLALPFFHFAFRPVVGYIYSDFRPLLFVLASLIPFNPHFCIDSAEPLAKFSPLAPQHVATVLPLVTYGADPLFIASLVPQLSAYFCWFPARLTPQR